MQLRFSVLHNKFIILLLNAVADLLSVVITIEGRAQQSVPTYVSQHIWAAVVTNHWPTFSCVSYQKDVFLENILCVMRRIA